MKSKIIVSSPILLLKKIQLIDNNSICPQLTLVIQESSLIHSSYNIQIDYLRIFDCIECRYNYLICIIDVSSIYDQN